MEGNPVFPMDRGQPVRSGKNNIGAGAKFPPVFARPSGHDPDVCMPRKDDLANFFLERLGLGGDADNRNVAHLVKATG